MRILNSYQRLAVIGKTGSGKTQAALWHLSQQDFDSVPWLLLDFKREPMLSRIPGVENLSIDGELPREAGLYRVTPQPQQEEEVTELLWALWRQGNMGLFVDEGYMLSAENPAYNALLTQGRTKRIPIITLAQRPVRVSRFVLSEAEFIQVFHLTDARDRSTVQSFVPSEVDIETRLPRFHSYYYDVANEEFLVLKPVPDETDIMANFEAQLVPPLETEDDLVPVRRLRIV